MNSASIFSIENSIGVMNLEIDEAIVNRLKDKIVEKENKNLSTKEMTDTKMIEWIKKRNRGGSSCC